MVLVTFQDAAVPPGDMHVSWEGFKCCQRAGQASGIENYVGAGVRTRVSAGPTAISKSNAL